MTPPEAEGLRQIAGTPEAPPAVSVLPASRKGGLVVIPQRADFLKAASARRQGTGSFLLQARDRHDGDSVTRIGFTASKKIGNAVLRNRAKRRMREAARALLPRMGRPGWDYVLVARPEATVSRDFALLLADLESAFAAVHRERPPREPKPGADKPLAAVEGPKP
ncbi:ribonuclease P protein component [Pseudogemmobacter humi]|uniref:Ribonuclease P protein component n=1 Tax=Pseudogemmobacter humi TaxID=2483812 RepID=A0A3P5X7W0_9RHOB|nr:ribonuclease P protein component [Pseudogemmobacter humi]VDC26356.1 Ribonuclease P protein component [Pseudogemmobacter humi]